MSTPLLANHLPRPDWQAQRVVVTGGAGFLGSAVVRVLAGRGVDHASLKIARSREHDLTTFAGASRLLSESFGAAGPTCIIHCAGAVGGIQANRDQPGRFFYANMAMSMHMAEAVRVQGLIEKGCVLVQVGSMTSYPASAPIPYREESLFDGFPDAASAPYGVAKLAAWQLLDAYHRQYGLRAGYVIPVNLYGPGDSIADVRNAHVAGSLVKRFVDAARGGVSGVVCWGTGAPTREFLYVDDAAEGVVRCAERAMAGTGGGTGEPVPINLGSGREIAIRELASLIAGLAGYAGRVEWDSSKPDGQARRCLDTSRAAALLGWRAAIPLEEGLRRTVAWYAGLPREPRP